HHHGNSTTMRITLLVVLALLTLTAFTGVAAANGEHAPGETHETGGGLSGTTVVGGIAGLAAVIGIGWWLWTRYGRG
ncbi:MAG: hypothetical protein ABEI97_04900, partial [Candidatus Nanohaloarchaea archaeon]